MKILGIETSCDETAAAVVEDGTRVLSNVIASSLGSFTQTGGVIPEEAARQQIRCIVPVITAAMKEAECAWTDLDAIAVTRGPGLLGSLLIGAVTARALATLHHLPLIGVHHTLGHLSSTWLGITDTPQFPILTLSASGGHTELWLRESHTKGELLGVTRDDAAGEAFDKGASLLGLPYPGGPSLSALAAKGNPNAFVFPHPLHKEDTLDFSFSGLKTALRYLLRDEAAAGREPAPVDVAASYEAALCTQLLDRVERALVDRHTDVRELHIVGGVSANRCLREMAVSLCKQHTLTLRTPQQRAFCTDNGAMIAAGATFLWNEAGDKAVQDFITAATLPHALTA